MEILNNIKNITFQEIPLQDLKTIKIFQNGDTNGIFQFESSGMKQFLKKLHPENFQDLANAIALFRPGPASNIPSFVNRKEGKEEITYFDKRLEKILKPTYGIIIYQEQIILIAREVANYSLGEADILRKAMSKKKKDILEQERNNFLKKALNNNYSLELATKIYNLILKFASYGFNKSHSIAYTIIAYKMGYLKANYPKYFYLSLLNSVISDVNKTKEYLLETKKYHLTIIKPNLNLSTSQYELINDEIIAPFNIISGISKIVCLKLIQNRKEKYLDIYDFFVKNNDLSKKTYEILIEAGIFDSLNYTRKTLLNNLDSLLNYASLSDSLTDDILKPEIINYPEFDLNYLTQKEKELYGFFLNNHPVLEYKSRELKIINLIDIDNYFNQRIIVIVLVEFKKEIITKKGDKMLFFLGSDEEIERDFTVFPNEYKKYQDLQKGDIIKVYGKVEKRNGLYQIIVSSLEKLNK